MITKTALNDNRNEIKGIKKGYTSLTNNNLLITESKNDKLMGKLQKKFRKTKDEIIQLMREI